MKIIQYFVTRKITTFFLLFGIFGLGIFSYNRIPSSLLPDLDTKGITIVIRYPGQSPFTIEEIITKPVENAISTIGGIEQIISSSEDNQARIYIYFEHDVDIRFKSYEVREKIEPVRASFPRDVNEPEVYLHSNEYSPVIIISLSSTVYSLNQLREIAEKNIKTQIERIDGISRIEVGGGSKREINITCDNNYMVAHSISLQDIIQAIQHNNFVSPIGVLHTTSQDYTITLHSKFSSIEDISSLPIFIPSAQSVIPLSHFGIISSFAPEQDSIARYNGSEHISLYIYKSSIANPLVVSHDIESLIRSINVPDIQCKIIYNEANDIKKVVHNLYKSCMLGIVLTICILSSFLKSIRLSLPAIIAIPFCLMGIGIYLYAKNSSLNIITLSGIAIAIGMVVDNSIITIEHITQKTRNIHTHSVVQSTADISNALLASSLTTIAIFIPFIVLKQKSTATYIELAGVVIAGIVASYIVAIIFVPWLLIHGTTCQISFRLPHATSSWITAHIQHNSYSKIFITRCKNIKLKNYYSTILQYAFSHKRIIFLLSVCFAATTLIPARNLHFEQVSFTQENKVFARLELSSGSSLDATAIAAYSIEEQCKDIPYIADISTRIEPSHADFIFTLHGPEYIPLLQSRIKPPHNASLLFTRSTGEIKDEIEIVIKGSDIAVIRDIAKALAQKLLSIAHVQDIVYHFKEERPQITVEFDHISCAHHGIPVAFAGNYIRSALYGPVISKYIENGEIDVRCRSKKPVDIETDLAALQLPYQNNIIALKEIARITSSSTITTLWHHDRMRAETISIVPHNNAPEKLENQLHSTIESMNIPDGYYIEFGKRYTEQKKSKYYLVLYVVIAVMATYLVLGAIFESFILPFIVMIAIPFSWICALWAVYMYGASLNIVTALGLIVLTGTVVNNSILLIDSYTNALSKKKTSLSLHDYIHLSLQRLRPMSMTTLTTASGLFPLLFAGGGNSFWQGFAITIIAGLCGALAIIMIITPVMFDVTIKMCRRRDSNPHGVAPGGF